MISIANFTHTNTNLPIQYESQNYAYKNDTQNVRPEKIFDTNGTFQNTIGNSTFDISNDNFTEYAEIPYYIKATSMAFCIVIMCLGVIGNVMVPIVILKTKDMRNSTNIFLVNLSIADLMVLLVCTPTVLVEVNSKPETWVLGKELFGMHRGLLNGGSYILLGQVYRVTTIPNKKNEVKKILHLGGKAKKKLEPLLNKSLSDMSEMLTEDQNEEEKKDLEKMPSMNAEETALLSLLPIDSMDDIELKNIQLQFPTARRFSGDTGCTEVRVRTDRGDIVVAVQGDRSKPAIFTYHDLGLNYVCFQPFFNFVDMRALLENFCVYHVNAPGQEEGAPSLPEDYIYPTMDELANQLNYVLGHFGIKSFIGFGVGAGANILARFALTNSQKVDALALINCTSSQAGWIEWAYQKMNSRSLRSRGMTQGVLDYLMWHHFGRYPEERNHDLAQMYRTYFTRNVNPTNLSMFIDAYVRRTDLGISRETGTIKPPVLNITGALSPHVDDTVTFNGRLQPTNSTWMKISDSGMVLEEQPGKISEAFRLFLQGEGYVAPLSPTKIVAFRRLSDGARRRPCRHSPVIRITENPISEAVVC